MGFKCSGTVIITTGFLISITGNWDLIIRISSEMRLLVVFGVRVQIIVPMIIVPLSCKLTLYFDNGGFVLHDYTV